MPHPTLAGRRILVTGATSGIGAVMAHSLAVEQGAEGIAVGRREDRLSELEAQITAAGGRAQTHALSLTDVAAVNELCAQLSASGIDDLILNAGVTSVAPFDEGSFEADEAIVATNVTANLQLIRNLLPALTADKVGGRVMLIASLGGMIPMPYQAVYAGSKAFLVNFGLSLREELKPAGLCVLTFAPGGIATEMTNIDALENLQSALAPVDEVAAAAIKAFVSRRSLTIPGVGNKLVAMLSRLLPRPLLAVGAERLYRSVRESSDSPTRQNTDS